MKYLIGLDDTDNKDSRGTGFKSRQLATELANLNICKPLGITRHQLFVHPNIPFTSHNSSACIEAEATTPDEIISYAREFLLKNAEVGSDAGLCVSELSTIPEEVKIWGKRAKIEVLTMNEAYQISKNYNILLEGLTGEKTGIIGSLAAIGLRADGNDGRYLMLNNFEIRDLNGIYSATHLKQIFPQLAIFDVKNNIFVAENSKIFLGEWMRPVLRNGLAVLIVESVDNKEYSYKAKDKEYIKQISN